MNKRLKILRAQRKRLLNRKYVTENKFEEIQNKLNEIELEIELLSTNRGE